MKNTIIFIVAIFVAGASGFMLHQYIHQQQVQQNPVIGTSRPEFAAMDPGGKLHNINEWDGKLIFLNFWATWCPPCLEEIPGFIELQKAYGSQGLQFVGIALDNKEAVEQYIKTSGMNYPSLLAEIDGIDLAKRYGNDIGGLPYTVIINKNGEIIRTVTGELSKKSAEKILEEQGIKL
jgi:thiol-disulfide isomerase/thioredoxin